MIKDWTVIQLGNSIRVRLEDYFCEKIKKVDSFIAVNDTDGFFLTTKFNGKSTKLRFDSDANEFVKIKK